MRIFLSTFGTDGDLVTFGRLAARLGARGHDVTAHSWAMYQRRFFAGVPFVAAALDRDRAALHQALVDAMSMATPWLQIGRFARLFYGLGRGTVEARAYFERCRAAMAGHDLAVCNVLDHLGHAAAEAAGVPWCTLASRPPPAPADGDGPLAEVDAALGALVTEATGARADVRTFRARSPTLDLVAGSPALMPPGPPRDRRLKITGAWLDPATDAPLPERVAAFLDAGPALLVSFGTVPSVDGRDAAIVAAARREGWRVLAQVLPPEPAPRAGLGVLVVRERLPYGALLPRVAAVVCHGGAGTVHEIVRAGRPLLAIPHMADQYYWSRAVAARGIGPAPLGHRVRDPAALSERLSSLREPAFARRATELGAAVAREDGLAAAVREIEARGSAVAP